MALELAPMGLHTMEAVTVATGDSVTGRDITKDQDEDPDKCEQLVSAIPYVAELRTDANGGVEIRQWALSGTPGKTEWTIVPDKDSSPEGWHPQHGFADLDFTPPLQTVLSAEHARYLIFAPAQADDTRGNEQMVSFVAAFGPADGTFRWRGRLYDYAVAKTLPCFASAS